MKFAVVLTFALVSSGAFAKGQVFCKENGKIINVLSEDGFDCQGAIFTGDVCFTGNANEAAEVLESDTVSDYFDGTDGEYITNVRVKNKDTITYTRMDDANEWSDKVTIKRCLGSWFRN